MAATRDDWETSPIPADRAAIALERTYAPCEFARLREGNVPRNMDDRWFVFYEEPWLYLHRSWTGLCMYQVRFEPAPGGMRVAEVLVNRDPEQFRRRSGAEEVLLLALLLDGYAGRDTKEIREQLRARW